MIFSNQKNILLSNVDVIHSLARCRSVEIRDPPHQILGPSFVAGNVATVQVVVEEVGMNFSRKTSN